MLGLLKGASLGDSLLLSNEDYIMVTAVWYLTNHSIAGVVPNVWTLIKDSPVGNGVQVRPWYYLYDCPIVFVIVIVQLIRGFVRRNYSTSPPYSS